MSRKLFQIPHINAGLISLIVGYTSSAVLVFQAAQLAGATQEQITSWFWALGVGIGLLTISMSCYWKQPIVIAWSTPGAALLISILGQYTLGETIGAFIFASLLTLILGISGLFTQLIKYIPSSLANAMLAGLLVKFGIELFVALESHTLLVAIMLISYLVINQLNARFSVSAALIVGLAYLTSQHSIHLPEFSIVLSPPTWTTPQWSISALLNIGLPLFIVTMASQNIPGSAMLTTHGYNPPMSKIMSSIGLVNTLLAPFGAFCLNLAAIMSAICVTDESEKDPEQRYKSAVWTGIFYLIGGIFASTTVTLLMIFPKAMVTAIAGIALLKTIGGSLRAAMEDDQAHQINLVVFLLAASEIALWHISGAFLGLMFGTSLLWWQQRKRSHLGIVKQ